MIAKIKHDPNRSRPAFTPAAPAIESPQGVAPVAAPAPSPRVLPRAPSTNLSLPPPKSVRREAEKEREQGLKRKRDGDDKEGEKKPKRMCDICFLLKRTFFFSFLEVTSILLEITLIERSSSRALLYFSPR